MNVPLKIVVGIATAGRREQVALTLAQLGRQRRQPDRVIVCPASDADYAEAVSPLAVPIEVVGGKRGLCAQRNLILSAASDADVLVFFDDDFYPAVDYLEQIERLFSQQVDLVIATHHPRLDGASGPGVAHEQALSALQAFAPLTEPVPPVRPTYAGYGCNMALRLSPVRTHQLWFDENLPLYGWLEDVDFSRRLAPFGRIVEAPQLRGVHLGTKGGRTSGVRLGYSQIANPVYMVRKGSLRFQFALKHICRNVAKNTARSLRPEPWVDRRGRLRGNALAIWDLAKGQLHPRKVTEFT